MTAPLPTDLDARGRRLRAAVAAVLVSGDAPELWLVHNWLDSWSGIGLVIAGITHQGWDAQLTAYASRYWRANFYPVGVAHSVVGGSAYEPTPWRAVQRAPEPGCSVYAAAEASDPMARRVRGEGRRVAHSSPTRTATASAS